jgi:hypothetical protein
MPSSFRPRFSLRTLAIFIAIVGAYFGAWEATKRFGARVPTTSNRFFEKISDSPAPFLLREQTHFLDNSFSEPTTVYYLWLVGPKWKLPLDSKTEQWKRS